MVHQVITHHMVGGRILTTDSTHIKVNAKIKEERPKEYLEEVEAAVTEDRIQHGKKH